MLRVLVSVVLGYLVMTAIVMAAFSLVLIAPDFAFQRGRFDVRASWLVYTLAASAFAAAAGGWVAAEFGRTTRAPLVFAALILVMGLASAWQNSTRPRPPETLSPSGMSAVERASHAVQPGWYALVLPFLGAGAGVLGGRLAFHPPRSGAASRT
jgi:hypothetical protein